jgi:hypothetical protein
MKWYADLPFELVVPVTMPKSELPKWREAIEVIADSCKTFKSGVQLVRLHHHEKERKTYGYHHPMGISISEEHEIILCAKDIDTAIHEAAHVKSNENHTPKWARIYVKMARHYMTDEFLRTSMKNACKHYRPVRPLVRKLGILAQG